MSITNSVKFTNAEKKDKIPKYRKRCRVLPAKAVTHLGNERDYFRLYAGVSEDKKQVKESDVYRDDCCQVDSFVFEIVEKKEHGLSLMERKLGKSEHGRFACNKKVMKFALTGCGLWGAVILRDLVQLGNQVSVVELDSQHAADALSLGAERTWKELKDITNVDAVIIATPASTHAEIIHALDAMGNMLPIFCEKPLVDSSAYARGLLLRSGPPLFVMHTWRYHPGVIKFRELYAECQSAFKSIHPSARITQHLVWKFV